ncbi:hypothetical protein D3C72_1326620 [compost metagenome]
MRQADGAPADHVANVQLGRLVVAHVLDRIAVGAQAGDQVLAFMRAVLQADANEDLRPAVAGPAVVELGDRAAVEAAQEAVIVVAAVGHGHGQQGLGALADLGPLGDVAQAVEIDVGARVDGHQGAASGISRGPDLHARERDGARRFGHGAHVVEDVLHRRADLVRVDQDDVVQQVAAQAEGLVARSLHRHPVGE